MNNKVVANNKNLYDFSYLFLIKLLLIAKKKYNIVLFSQIPDLLNQSGPNKPHLILRHDIDISVKKTIRMAEIEYSLGIRSTYMVMVNNPLYSIKNKDTKKILREIIRLGHEIGLHYELDKKDKNNDLNIEIIGKKINIECEDLKQVVGVPVKSVSFHRPPPQFLRGPIQISNKINAYSKDLMREYFSDSKGRWQVGDPTQKLQFSKEKTIQLLIHPIWWGEKHMLPKDRLEEFVENETLKKSKLLKEKFYNNLKNFIPGVEF